MLNCTQHNINFPADDILRPCSDFFHGLHSSLSFEHDNNMSHKAIVTAGAAVLYLVIDTRHLALS